MPFGNNVVRLFTHAVVTGLSQEQMGVYGLFKGNEWIYIGSGDIRERLMRHLGGDNPCITRHGATHWIMEVNPDYVARERELIGELGPTLCNRRIG